MICFLSNRRSVNALSNKVGGGVWEWSKDQVVKFLNAGVAAPKNGSAFLSKYSATKEFFEWLFRRLHG